MGERDVGRGRMVGQGCFVCRWRCQKKKKKMMMGFDDGSSCRADRVVWTRLVDAADRD